VHRGDPCPAEGATGRSEKDRPMVCTARHGGEPHWRGA
jgi:hypothetical protein